MERIDRVARAKGSRLFCGIPANKAVVEGGVMARILLITGDAGEAQEIYYAKYRLEEEGWTVHVAALAKRTFLSVVHDFEPGFDTYSEKPGYRVDADLGVRRCRPDDLRRARASRRPRAGVSPQQTEGRRGCSPFRRVRQADRGELPRTLARHRGWRLEGENNYVLPRP